MEPITMTKVTSTAAYVSAATTGYMGWTLNEIGVAVGIVATIVTVAINWYFKQQHLKLAREQLARSIRVSPEDDS